MNTNTNNITLEAAAAYFKQLGEAGSAVLYKICQPEASPADIAAALDQKLDKDGKPRSTDVRISGVSQLIQAGFIVTASVPEGGLKPVSVRRSGGSAAAIAAAKAEAQAEAEAAKAEAEAAALATVTEAAFTVLKATSGNAAALAGMPEAAVSAALKRWEAEEAAALNAANAEAAALLAKCAEAAGVEAADLLDWIESVKTSEAKKAKKA